MRQFVGRVARVAWLPLVAIALWEGVSRLRPNPFFSAPSKVVSEGVELSDSSWWVGVAVPTVLLCVGGYLLGAASGVVLGTLIGSNPLARRVLGPVAVFVRSTPIAATIPVIVGIFGLGSVSQFVAVAMVVGLQVLLVTMLGVSKTDIHYRDSARVMRFSSWESLVLVRLPGAIEDILVALQSSVQTALLVAITVEILAGGSGIGRFVTESLGLFRVTSLWWAVIIVGLVGVILNELYVMLERRIAPWFFHQKGITRGN